MKLSGTVALLAFLGAMGASRGQAQNFASVPAASGLTFVAPGSAYTGLAGQAVNPANTYVSTVSPDAYNNIVPGFIRLSDLGAPTSTALTLIAARLDRDANRFRQGIAMAGAINVLPPNAGDRFAVSFGGAGYDGAGAGSIAVSARVNENTIAYLGYARGPTQNLVKGGVGFSFR